MKEEMLVVPKLYVPIPTCMLHVIDNDSGQELPRVFHKVAPYVYKRNKVCICIFSHVAAYQSFKNIL